MPVRLPTFLGNLIDPFNVKTSDIHLADIAYGLAHTYRYGGQLAPGITVAEHSVLVSRLVESTHPDHPDLLALMRAALLHDASEAYLHDIQAPLRPFVFVQGPDGGAPESWVTFEQRINVVACEAFDVDPALLQAHQVTAADAAVVSFEVLRSNLQHIISGTESAPHLTPRYLAPSEARLLFLSRASEILLGGLEAAKV